MRLPDEIVIVNATIDDLNELHAIETVSFPAGMAAGYKAFRYRLNNYPQWFYKAEFRRKTIGLIDGCSSERKYITDDLYQINGDFNECGDNLLIFGLAVHPDYRGRGAAHKLMRHILYAAKADRKKRASLTCRENLIGFYESFGFKNHGVSNSVIGGVQYYDMEINL